MNLVKTIHQIWLQGACGLPNTPDKPYKKYSERWRELNKPYGYILWDEPMILRLMSNEYPELLETYNGYQFWVMRTDLARYMILHKYGGFYIDMDHKPIKSIAPLASGLPTFYSKDFNWFIHFVTYNVYINNNFLYFPYPYHPLAELIVKRARGSHIRNFYDFKVLYVIEKIGPHFLMEVINEYISPDTFKTTDKIRVIPDAEIEKYFHDEEANSWIGPVRFDLHDSAMLGLLAVFFMLLICVFRFKAKR